MRVQHVWAKTGTSPVAFHNTTRDVALCPASEQRPGRVFVEIKGRKSVISNGPGRLWHSLIPVSGWGNDTRGRAPPRPRPRRPLTPPTRPSPDQGSHRALALARRAWALAAPATFVAVGIVPAGPVGWLVGSARAGAMTVCRRGARVSAADVIVYRRGRYTTRTTHKELYVLITCGAWCRWERCVDVRVPTASPMRIWNLSATPSTSDRACQLGSDTDIGGRWRG
jgi:hypothetical protein